MKPLENDWERQGHWTGKGDDRHWVETVDRKVYSRSSAQWGNQPTVWFDKLTMEFCDDGGSVPVASEEGYMAQRRIDELKENCG